MKKDFSEKTWKRLERLDDAIHDCYRHNREVFWEALSLHFLVRVVGVFEVYLIGRFLDIPMSFMAALFLTSVTPLINMLFAIIPNSIGVLEGSTALIFHWIGLVPADGVSLQIIRRLRSLIWTAIGLLVIATHRHPKTKAVPTQARP